MCNGGITLNGVPVCPIPNVWQLVLAQIPIKGWVINPDEHGLLDGPGDAWDPLSTREIVQFYGMTCSVAVVINGGGGS